MEKHSAELITASRVVSIALHLPKVDAKEAYGRVALLAREHTETGTPLLFWRKWVSSPGIEYIVPVGGAQSWFSQYRVDETAGKSTVFVEGPNRNVDDTHDHMLLGVARAREAGARQVGLITGRRHFTDYQLDTFRALDWVLVSDRLDDQRERLDRLTGPGRMREFPGARGHACYRSTWDPEATLMHPPREERVRHRLVLV